MAAFRALIHRLVTLPLTKAGYRKELNTILEIANNNGYEKQPILRMLRKKKESLENRTLFNGATDESKWITVPYNGVISEEIKKTIQEGSNHKVTFSNKPNLGRILINTKNQRMSTLDCSGIYQINCQCGMKYVGQTGRKIGTRVNEHLSHARLQKFGKSSLADHLINSNHDPEATEVQVKKKCAKGKKMNLYEQFYIESHKGDNLLNNQQESEVTTLVAPPILVRNVRMHQHRTGNAIKQREKPGVNQ